MTHEHVRAERFWEEYYKRRGQVWSGQPNEALVRFVEPLDPRTALDLGCGEGGDAIWLARRGWQVTAVDVSPTALDRAARGAAVADVTGRVEFRQADLATTFPDGTFDLVSAHYLQSPIELPRERILQRAAAAVAPGGFLLVVEHGSAPSWARDRGDRHAEPQFCPPEERLAALELDPLEWRTEHVGRTERSSRSPGGEQGTILDSIVAVWRAAR